MENLLRVITIVVILISAASAVTADCPPEMLENWRPMTFSGMFRHDEIAVLIKGRVVQTYPPKLIPRFSGEVITALVELECVYRGVQAVERRSYINVTGFGYTDDCVNTLVTEGESYLMFLEPFSYGPHIQYAIHEFNLQRGAFEVTNTKLAAVSSVYECRTVTNSTTTLAPWQSLTPIKKIPWIILPKDIEPRKDTPFDNGGKRLIAPCHLVLNFCVITLMLLLW